MPLTLDHKDEEWFWYLAVQECAMQTPAHACSNEKGLFLQKAQV